METNANTPMTAKFKTSWFNITKVSNNKEEDNNPIKVCLTQTPALIHE